MKIPIIDVKNEIGKSRYFAFSEILQIDDENKTSDISADITITNTGDTIILEGNVKTCIILKCSRCLKDFNFSVNSAIFEQFSESPKHYNENTDVINLLCGDFIDTEDIFRQNILLEIPIKPLCKKDCLGLCLKCGQDLNEKKCSCKKESTNSRFSILKELLDAENPTIKKYK